MGSRDLGNVGAQEELQTKLQRKAKRKKPKKTTIDPASMTDAARELFQHWRDRCFNRPERVKLTPLRAAEFENILRDPDLGLDLDEAKRVIDAVAADDWTMGRVDRGPGFGKDPYTAPRTIFRDRDTIERRLGSLDRKETALDWRAKFHQLHLHWLHQRALADWHEPTQDTIDSIARMSHGRFRAFLEKTVLGVRTVEILAVDPKEHPLAWEVTTRLTQATAKTWAAKKCGEWLEDQDLDAETKKRHLQALGAKVEREIGFMRKTAEAVIAKEAPRRRALAPVETIVEGAPDVF